MNLRTATDHDARSIAVVHVASIRQAYGGLFPGSALDGIDIDDRAVRWRQILTDARSTTLVAESNERILGFVNYGPCRDEDVAVERVGEILSIYVAPDAWGGGVGRSLMQSALARLASAGFCAAKLWVLDQNTRAIAFYERAGFARDGSTKHREMFGVPITVVRYHGRLGSVLQP
ncbi:MAG TPA: GNAT family N-acetyltransferase [Chloroflexota bacterium]|nr:GNAT family N-acetyltransferase [Chloroflexota bacterium]